MKKIHLALLAALPIVLGLYMISLASWRPRTLVQYPARVPKNYPGGALSVAFSPDGKQVATCGGGNVVVWDVEKMRVVRVLKSRPGKYAGRAAFSPDGRWIAASYLDQWNDMEGGVQLWNAATGKSTRLWRRHRSMTGVAFSRDSRTLAGSGYIDVALWDVESGRDKAGVGVGDTFWVQDVALSPDGQIVIGLGELDAIYSWDVRKAARDDYWGEQFTIRGYCAAFSPDGATLAVGATGRVLFFNVPTRRVAHRLLGQKAQVNSVAFSLDGALLAAGGSNGTIELWDVASRKSLRLLLGHRREITSLAFAPNASTLASSSADGTVRLWRIK